MLAGPLWLRRAGGGKESTEHACMDIKTIHLHTLPLSVEYPYNKSVLHLKFSTMFQLYLLKLQYELAKIWFRKTLNDSNAAWNEIFSTLLALELADVRFIDRQKHQDPLYTSPQGKYIMLVANCSILYRIL